MLTKREEQEGKRIATFRRLIEQSERMVFFGGAGVSTASGVPDFRGENGLYRKYPLTAEEMLDIRFFNQYPEQFYKFYRQEMLFSDIRPNAAHYALAQLERQGKLKAVITQNIDGLHQMAGSKKVLELHGSNATFHCVRCQKQALLEQILQTKGVPRCSCGGVMRPDIVFYGESLPERVVEEALHFIREADLFVVGGTSLVVYPAASFLRYYKGNSLVLINRDATQFDLQANLILRTDIAQVFEKVMEQPM